jgi:hypothetical protein
MCFILKQNAGRGLIQERADIIPLQFNIVLCIEMRKSLNRNVLMGREKKSYDQDSFFHLAFARMPRAEARGGMARGDRGVARRAKSGSFGAVPLGFATDAPRGRAGSFTLYIF